MRRIAISCLVPLVTALCCLGCGPSQRAEPSSQSNALAEELSTSKLLAEEIAAEGAIVSVRCRLIAKNGPDWWFDLCDVEHENGTVAKWCVARTEERVVPLQGGAGRCERFSRPKKTEAEMAAQPLRRVRHSSQSLDGPSIASRDPDRILAAVLARYGGSAIVETRYGRPPPGWTGTENPSIPLPPHYRNGRWLHITVAAPALGAESVRPTWEATMVAAAIRDELHLAGVKGDVIGALVSVRLPNGEIQQGGGGVGMAEFGQSFSTDDEETIERGVRRRAQELGLEVKSVDILHALQPAPAVVLVLHSDPQEFVRRRTVIYELFGAPSPYEGHYVEVLDPSGDPVVIYATDFRSGVGMMWIRPDLDDRRKARANR